MTSADIAAALTSALEAAAAREAGAPCTLVSVNLEMLGAPAQGRVSVTLGRKTRTLVFLNAAFESESGARIASAASVHRVAES